MRIERFLATLALLVAWSCGEDEKPRPPGTNPPSDAGESSGGASGASGSSGTAGTNGGEPAGGTAGVSGGAAGSGGAGEGGESAGGTGGSSGTASGGTGGSVRTCPSDAQAGAPPALTAICDPNGAWGAAVDVPLMDGAAQLVGVTPDELTIAWYGIANMDTAFYVADRASVGATFDPGQALESRDYLSISPDGLRVFVLSEAGRLVELVRTARGQAFGAPAEGAFATLDADADANDLTFYGAIVSPDDRTLYYLVSDGESEHLLHVSTRADTGAWPVGTGIEACELEAHDGLLRQPTGVSADGLTLFYNDYARGITRAAWRETPSEAFVWFVDLGTRDRSQPNTDCSRLYFSATSGPAYAEGQ